MSLNKTMKEKEEMMKMNRMIVVMMMKMKLKASSIQLSQIPTLVIPLNKKYLKKMMKKNNRNKLKKQKGQKL